MLYIIFLHYCSWRPRYKVNIDFTLIQLHFLSIVDVSNSSVEPELATATDMPQAQLDALHDFYISLNGEHWTWEDIAVSGNPWNFTGNQNPCTHHWQGVACDTDSNVAALTLIDYNLVGTLPSSLSDLEYLTTLSLSTNKIHGTLPPELGDISTLFYLNLDSNYLSGSLPPKLGQLNVQTMTLEFNHLTGTIPDSFANLQQLYYCVLAVNQLSGTLPSFLSSLPLRTLDLFDNRFSGSIPALPSTLAYLLLGRNHLTSSLPDTLSLVTGLQTLSLYLNGLTGTIPSSYGALTALQNFKAYGNQLRGTLPEEIGNWSQLLWFDLHDNLLTGSIPNTTGNWALVWFVALNHNKLTGTIPRALSRLPTLAEMLLEHNCLSGSLAGLFEPTAQRALTVVQLNDNQLTGSLPAEVFRLPALETFAAVSNCITGTLPGTVCDAASLHSLILDGLGSATSCRRSLLPGVTGSYTLRHRSPQPLPSCLFAMPNLTALHLSGTGLTGTLPDAVRLSPKLVSLSLSHNALTGTIPAQFQEQAWFEVDLSYNRLSGSLLAGAWEVNDTLPYQQFTAPYLNAYSIGRIERLRARNFSLALLNVTIPTLYVAVYLDNNRLSGRIPHALQTKRRVAILGSNVFSCDSRQTNLPTHDGGADHYQCGSDSFNAQYYAWLGLVTIVTGTVLAMLVCRESLGRYWDTEQKTRVLSAWYSAVERLYAENKLSRTSSAFTAHHTVVLLAARCAAYILVVLLPVYAACSRYHGTMTHQYAWVASGAFLSGVVPVALMFVLLLGLVALVYVSLASPTSRTSATHDITRDNTSHRPEPSDDDMVEVRLESTDTEVSAATEMSVVPDTYLHDLRGAAVYAVYLTVNLVVVIGVNVAYVYVVIYQGSNILLLAQVLLSVFKLLWNNLCAPAVLRSCVKHLSANADEDKAGAVETRFAALQIFVALFNNIAVPCLVVAMVSPSCFYNVFVAAAEVTSQYTYDTCLLIDRSTGQCNILTPVIGDTSYAPPFQYNYQCSSGLVTYYAPAFVSLCIVSGVLAPIAELTIGVLYHRAVPGTPWHRLLTRFTPRHLLPVTAAAPHLRTVADGGTYVRSHPLFNASRVLVGMITLLGLLLTFGALFPPLAACLALTVITVTALFRLRVGRVVSASEQGGLRRVLRLVEGEFRGLGTQAVIQTALWMLVTVSCWFYTLFLFDTLGDAVGFERAYWVLIVMPLMPVILFALHHARHWYIARKATTSTTAPPTAAADRVDTINILQGAGAAGMDSAEDTVELAPRISLAAATGCAATINSV